MVYIKKVLLVSFFLSDNLGDKLLSKSIEDMLTKKNYEVMKFDFLTISKVTENKPIKSLPNENLRTKKRLSKKILYSLIGDLNTNRILYKIKKVTIHKRNWESYKHALQEVDELVIGGGNMLMDITSIWPNMFYDYIKVAKKLKKKVKVVFIGVGPLKFQENKKLISKASKLIDFISVRDARSKKIMKNISPELNIIETVDPVFLMNFVTNKRRTEINTSSIESNNIKIGVCILSEICFDEKIAFDQYIQGIKSLIKELFKLNNNINIILFSTEKMDYVAVDRVFNDLKDYKDINIKKVHINSLHELNELYLDINFLIGGRMHSLILGQKFLLPSIGFIWQEKLISYSQITNSKERMYSIESLSESSADIARKISILQNDLNLINKMNLRNKQLEKIVDIGLDVVRKE